MPLAPELRRRSGRIFSPPSRRAMPSPGKRSSSRSKPLWRTGGGAGEGETEGTAVPLPGRFDPDTPAMHLDNPLDQGQTDAGAVAGPIQALEETKDLLVITWRNPYAIITDITDGLLGIPSHAKVDTRLGLDTHEFHGIIQQVLQHFEQPRAIPHDHRQVRSNIDLHPTSGDLPTDQRYGFLREFAKDDLGQRIDHAPDA